MLPSIVLDMERRILFRCKVGSHLYGLQRPESDTDYFTVFMPTAEDVLGIQKTEIVDNSTKTSSEERRNTQEDVDDKAYSLPRYLELLLQNNPNIVETLFATPDVIEVCEPEFSFLMNNADKIISTRVHKSFTGYAYAQRAKMTTKRERFVSLGKSLGLFDGWATGQEAGFLDAIHAHPQPHWRPITKDEADLLNSALKYYKGERHHCESFHVGMPLGMIYKKIRTEYEKYGWRVHTDSFERLGYDLKFAYNLIRLMAEGAQILATGRLDFPINGRAREDILRVRNGEVPYEGVLAMFDSYEKIINVVAASCILRVKPDWNWANKWLVNTLLLELRKETHH